MSNKGIAWPGGEPQSVRDTYDQQQGTANGGGKDTAEGK